MNLEQLLVEEKKIKERIDSSIQTIIEWFEEKIEKVKEIFSEMKHKVVEGLKDIKGKTASKDIKDENDKIIIKKGDSASKAASVINSKLSSVKTDCNEITRDCKEGISAAKSKDMKKVKTKKEKVALAVKQIALASVLILQGVGAYKDIKTAQQYRGLPTRDKGFDSSEGLKRGKTGKFGGDVESYLSKGDKLPEIRLGRDDKFPEAEGRFGR